MSLTDLPIPKGKEEALESPTGGSFPMNISGRMVWERERCVGMTEAERAWRSQWLKDQVLHDEPVIPENYYKERYNPIRRFYRAPMDKFEAALTKKWGWITGKTIRHGVANIAMGLAAVYGLFYWIKYNQGDWTRKGGPRMVTSRVAIYPGDPNYPKVHHPKDNEFASYGFNKSPI